MKRNLLRKEVIFKKNIKSKNSKLILLCVFCMFSFSAFSDYYCLYFLQTLEAPLIQKMNLSGKSYNFLISSNSILNLFTPYIFGFLYDKYGISRVFLFGALILLFSQFFMFLGLNFLNYYVILYGRILYGVSSEILAIGKV